MWSNPGRLSCFRPMRIPFAPSPAPPPRSNSAAVFPYENQTAIELCIVHSVDGVLSFQGCCEFHDPATTRPSCVSVYVCVHMCTWNILPPPHTQIHTRSDNDTMAHRKAQQRHGPVTMHVVRLCLCLCLSVCLSVCLCLCLSVSLSLCLCLSVCMHACMHVCLSVCMHACIYLSIYLSIYPLTCCSVA